MSDTYGINGVVTGGGNAKSFANPLEKEGRPLFGPSGSSESFAAEGHSATVEMPAWLKARGLDIFEYSFGRGVNISSATAQKIGDEFARQGIEISVHAPYFVNFASPEPEKSDNSVRYITSSLKVLRAFGGKRCVFHAGAQGGAPRDEAFGRTKDAFARTLEAIKAEGYDDMIVCPETMGKQAQIGTVGEVAELCLMGDNVYPCVDFGHINSLYGGILKTKDDFLRIIDELGDRIGEHKTRNMHVHFSKIQFGAKGEIRHLTFADDIYGPEFEPFAEAIVARSLTPHILSESAGTQAEDAAYMRDAWRAVANR